VEPTDPALALEGAERRFGDTLALDNLSFSVARGELYGLVGPDGAGKTTSVRAIAGLLDLDKGKAHVFGRSANEGSVRERLGLMPQQYSLYRDLSVGENLRFFAQLYALPKAVYKERSARLLEITRLAPFVERRADALSGGMYKKLALACALLHEPEVLLLDEPTNGVDPVSRRELWALLYEFVERGMAVLICTPYMDEAERCHRVGLLHQGRLLLQGKTTELLQNFADEVHEVMGGDRQQLEQALSGVKTVFASSPVGARLRLVLQGGAEPDVSARLLPLGATLRRVPPSFEDVYLARLFREKHGLQEAAS
jgi:ABC-2 type transport system ATP-binding protein